MPTTFYNNNAVQLFDQYLSASSEEVHGAWLHHVQPLFDADSAFDNKAPRILDIGAGAGRDAKFFAEKFAERCAPEFVEGVEEKGAKEGVEKCMENECQVFAVEPAGVLAKMGQAHTHDLNVKWIEDSLPALEQVSRYGVSFDLILLSAVWMHVPPSSRGRAIRKLANLLKPGGKLVITLRFGQGEADLRQQTQRKMHQVCIDELQNLAQAVGLVVVDKILNQADSLGRSEVQWQTLVLKLPDDGVGGLPILRHIIVNDNKSSTYKLALLRVLLRIADGHPGAVLRHEEDKVILPLGLVSLYWCRQFKPLLDGKYEGKHDGANEGMTIRQNSDPNKGLGFVKANGWQQLTSRMADDYQVGHVFLGDEAKALYRTLSVAAQTIRDMPCKYIRVPNSTEQLFHVNYQKVIAKQSLFLDQMSLSAWGEFVVPEPIWLSLSRLACWVEPVLINEWVNVMQGYRGNETFNRLTLLDALNWGEVKRTTAEVRSRVDALKQKQHSLECVWSEVALSDEYEIDHCMPFARWPNNDLWNLLPASCKANNQKRDKLPSRHRLQASEKRIHDWWQQAWLSPERHQDGYQLARCNTQSQRFFAQANLALPGLPATNTNVDDVFEAMLLQRVRLKEMQQLREW
ncbi:class I SAM-dependent methyltransferase [uncultured Shewanella sp.]|uniref:class I SAM-dependent methyltransferase n=1 Tax=uncultured Shewanella sp. TaxID=173975 RepID=UPI00261FA957|nr:class I SAM-dependent methyltransferase [uncultured Shewanella sp.]